MYSFIYLRNKSHDRSRWKKRKKKHQLPQTRSESVPSGECLVSPLLGTGFQMGNKGVPGVAAAAASESELPPPRFLCHLPIPSSCSPPQSLVLFASSLIRTELDVRLLWLRCLPPTPLYVLPPGRPCYTSHSLAFPLVTGFSTCTGLLAVRHC